MKIDSELAPHMREVVAKGARAIALRVVAAGTTFVLFMVLGRTLGAEDSGYFFLALSVVQMLSVIGRFGMEQSTTRFVSAAREEGDPASVKGVVSLATGIVALVSVLLAVFCFLTAPYLAQHVFSKPAMGPALQVMSLAIPFHSLTFINCRSLQGLRRTDQASIFMSMAIPLITLVLICLDALPFTVMDAARFFVVSSLAAYLGSLAAWRRSFPEHGGVRGSFSRKRLLDSSMPLLWVSLVGLGMLQSAELLVGVWHDTSSVAIYATANKASNLTNLIAIGCNLILAPKISALYSQGSLRLLSRLIRTSTLLLTLAGIPVMALFMLFPGDIMALFGPSFRQGGMVLMVLGVSQCLRLVAGSAGLLLMMSGRERPLRNISFISAVLNIVFCLLLIPEYGPLGAAIATASAFLANLALCVGVACRSVGIMVLPFLPQKELRDGGVAQG